MLGFFAVRAAAPAIACALLLTTQTACESCSFSVGGLRLMLTVDLVDAAGEPLPPEVFAGKLAAAELTVCFDGKGDEECMPTTPASDDAASARFTVDAYGEAYEPSAVSARCYYPTLTLRVEVPGCSDGEQVVPGGRTTAVEDLEIETLTLTCA